MQLHESLGFHQGHPFLKTNADEEPHLSTYFVPPPFFDGVIGDPENPSASIVLAPRGGGKTAQRRMVEEWALPNKTFAITYDRFEFGANDTLDSITLNYHLRNIITRILIGYLAYLGDYPDLIRRLSNDDKKMVSIFAHTYLGDMTGGSVQEALEEMKGLPDRIKDFWRNHIGFLESFINFLLKNYNLEPIDLPSASQEQKPLTSTYKYQLQHLARLVRSLGFTSLFILIDKIDETEKTGNDPHSAYKLIRPIVRDLELLGLRHYGFKLFLWNQLDPYYQSDARPDRINQYTLTWKRTALEQVLSRRLATFSNSNITNFNQLFSNQNTSIDRHAAICVLSNGSPRNVIRACEKILSAQSEIDPTSHELSDDAFESGITAFCDMQLRESYPESVTKELQKVGSELFTVNYLANEIFKVHQNSARNRITKWTDLGIVKQVGSISVDSSKKPLNLYYINDPVMNRIVHRAQRFDSFFANRWIPCSHCAVDNLMDIDLLPGANNATCAGCGRDLL